MNMTPIATSQTAHTNYKWPPYTTEWNSPMKIFCVRHWASGIFRVLASLAWRLFVNLVMMLRTLQLLSVHHNPSCDDCVRDVEGNRKWKESLVEKNVAKERQNIIYTFR